MGKRKPYFNDGRKNNGKNLNKGAVPVGIETRFQKGNIPRNKSLRTMLAEHGMTREVINEKFSHLLSSNHDELLKIKREKETTVLELMVVAIIEHGVKFADTSRMDNLIDKVFGKMPVEARNTNINYNVDAEIEDVADDDLIERAEKRKDKYKKDKK